MNNLRSHGTVVTMAANAYLLNSVNWPSMKLILVSLDFFQYMKLTFKSRNAHILM